MIPYGDYPDLSAVKRVLVIKLRHHGDVLLSSSVFSCLKHHLPYASIDAFIYGETLPMLAGNPWISTIHIYESQWKKLSIAKRVRRELRLAQRIRSLRYDLVINLTEGDRGAITGLFSGAPVRVGFNLDLDGALRKKFFYTHIVKKCSKPRHIVEQNIDALRRIGIFPAEKDRRLHLDIPPEAELSVKEYLDREGVEAGKYIAMHLTSRWLFKCWPLAKNIQLIKSMQEKGIPVVLSAAPDPVETNLIDRIIEECGSNGVVNLAGKLSLKELAALIRQSMGLFTIDSVPFHIANSLQKPVLALFGPSSELAWGPWQNKKARVIASQHSCRPCNLDGCGGGKVCDCMDAISVSMVTKAIIDLVASADKEN